MLPQQNTQSNTDSKHILSSFPTMQEVKASKKNQRNKGASTTGNSTATVEDNNDVIKTMYDVQIRFKAADQLGLEGWTILLSQPGTEKLDQWVLDNETALKESMVPDNEWPENTNVISRHLLSINLTDKLSEALLGKAIFCAVTGAFDKGKTWLVNLITEKNLPSGYTVETKGVSIVSEISCPGLKGQVIIGDTEGTGRALTEKQCITEEETLLKSYPKELAPLTIDESNLSSDKQITEENIHRRDILKSKALNMASMINNNTEKLLQEVIVDTADVIITVVGETIGMEQQYVKIMAERLNAQVMKNNGKHITYIVVHNFKNCSDKDELQDLIQKYILDIWGATKKENLLGKDKTVTTYVNESRAHKYVSIEHVYLGKHGTEAGSMNAANIERIRQCLSHSYRQQTENKILWTLLENIRTQLPEIYKKVSDVRLLLEKHTDGKNVLKMVHVNQSHKTLMPLQLISIEGEAKDYRYVTSDKKWSPQYDIVMSRRLLILNVDAPGLKYRGLKSIIGNPNISSIQPMDLISDYKIQPNQFSVLIRDKYFYIFGNRTLEHPLVKSIDENNYLEFETQFEKVYKVDVNVPISREYAKETNEMVKECLYENSEDAEWTDRKRNYGNFYQKIYCENLPSYSCVNPLVNLYRGVFSLILPIAPKEDVEDVQVI